MWSKTIFLVLYIFLIAINYQTEALNGPYTKHIIGYAKELTTVNPVSNLSNEEKERIKTLPECPSDITVKLEAEKMFAGFEMGAGATQKPEHFFSEELQIGKLSDALFVELRKAEKPNTEWSYHKDGSMEARKYLTNVKLSIPSVPKQPGSVSDQSDNSNWIVSYSYIIARKDGNNTNYYVYLAVPATRTIQATIENRQAHQNEVELAERSIALVLCYKYEITNACAVIGRATKNEDARNGNNAGNATSSTTEAE